MRRLTITLSDGRYRALKEASVTRRKTIGQLIEESLDLYGIKPAEDALALVRQARGRATLDEKTANRLAVGETGVVRGRRARPR